MKTARFELRILPVLCACLCLVTSSAALALEGGGSHYFGGNEDFSAGRWPPPGLSANLSVLSFNYSRLKDGNGQSVPVPGGFQVEGVSTSIRLMYVSGVEVLGGTLGGFVTPSLVYQHTSTGGNGQSKTATGDLNFGVVVKKDFGTFSHVVGSDFFAPTGAYTLGDVCNIGNNYWTLGPTYSFTYVGNRDSPIPRLEASARLAYYFRTTNHATGYSSGQDVSADYLLGYWLGDRGQLRIGVNGHYEKQVTDDEPENPPAGFDGYRNSQFTVGPAVQYSFGRAILTAKVQFGTYDRNRPEGTYFWLKFWYAF